MGPIGIAKMADNALDQGIFKFLLVMGSLSFGLGFLNLLPLSFLDGGQFLMAAIEAIKGSPLPPFALGFWNSFSFFLILLLLISSLFNDLRR